jgi:hypothetical protein
MEISTVVGSLGVGLLLFAFIMNLFRFISQDSRTYIILNILGAGAACVASVMISFVPFIILEVIWVLVGVAGLVKTFRRREEEAPFRL